VRPALVVLPVSAAEAFGGPSPPPLWAAAHCDAAAKRSIRDILIWMCDYPTPCCVAMDPGIGMKFPSTSSPSPARYFCISSARSRGIIWAASQISIVAS
jgi:hypothetical protein